jgi:hypothetical protein
MSAASAALVSGVERVLIAAASRHLTLALLAEREQVAVDDIGVRRGEASRSSYRL